MRVNAVGTQRILPTNQDNTQTYPYRNNRLSAGGGLLGPLSFVLTDYLDDFILVRVEQEPSEQTGLIVSASLASDNVKRRNSILSPMNSTD